MRRAGHKSFSFFRAPPIGWSENESITQCLSRAHVNQKGKPVKHLITYRTVTELLHVGGNGRSHPPGFKRPVP